MADPVETQKRSSLYGYHVEFGRSRSNGTSSPNVSSINGDIGRQTEILPILAVFDIGIL